MARIILALVAAAILSGCETDATPESGVADAANLESVSRRPTPLREEVDEAASVRDQVLNNSWR
jgi:PBP1b-binding outer membrane lipoprotein LpoB